MKSLIFLSSLVILISCKNKDQAESGPSLVGKWKPVEVNLGEMSEEEKADVLNYSSLEFTKDSNYVSIRKDDKQEGKFTFNPKDNSFRTIAVSGSDETFTLSWEKGLLRLTHEDGSILLKRQ